jgi:antitoxin component YwqK of YwqJK toxin-antitoxin module
MLTIERTHHTNGNVFTEKIYDGDNLTEENYYYENGNLHITIPYKHGCKNGAEKLYNADGSLSQEMTWVNDELHGYVYCYDNNILTRVILYKYDEIVDDCFY